MEMSTVYRFLVAIATTTTAFSLRWSPRQTTDCPLAPPSGCHCYEPWRPQVICSGLGLDAIPAFDWSSYNIHTLDLSRNHVTSWTEDSPDMSSLQRLFLAHNEITEWTPSTEDWLLRHLVLSDNRISTIPSAVGRLANLEVLDLSFNNIATIDWSVFNNNNALRKLYLDHNPVVAFESSVVLPSLLVLYVTPPDNGATPLPESAALRTLAFKGAPLNFQSLSEYFISHEHLRHLAYNSETAVEVADLVELPNELSQRLTHLSLANNSLSSSKDFWNWLSDFTELTSLDLSGNNMDSYDVTVFTGFPQLYHLNLEGNNGGIPKQLLTTLPSLRELNIRSNGLAVLQMNDDITDIHPSLLLRLADNPFRCNCKLHWLKTLIERQLAGDAWHLPSHEIHHEISCHSPASLQGRLLKDVPMEDLVC